MKPIPFDSLVLMAVAREAQSLVGAYLQRIRQSDEYTIALRFQKAGNLLLSSDPRFFRAHLASRAAGAEESHFLRRAREKLENTRLVSIRQNGFDRVLILTFEHALLVAELTGSRANLILVDAESKVVAAMRKIGDVRAGQHYEPPTPPAPDFETAVREGVGLSPFLRNEAELHDVVSAEWKPVLVEGLGAYPIEPISTGSSISEIISVSIGLEKHYTVAVGQADTHQGVQALVGQLERALDARSAAARQIESVLDTAGRARELQMHGELILAHASTLPEDANMLETVDYQDRPIAIKLNPEKTPVENAQRLFHKAKRAKNAAAGLVTKLKALRTEISEIEATIAAAKSLRDESPSTPPPNPLPTSPSSKQGGGVESLMDHARERGWLRAHRQGAGEAGERPYEGHKIRETVCPRGFKVIWSENATGNDYLVSRIAKPNDYWFHARGATGAHVVLQTGNKPERIQMDSLLFAALLAARHSSQKHATHVPVDYTLAKHVRKPRKSAPGSVTYSREKTLFVDP